MSAKLDDSPIRSFKLQEAINNLIKANENYKKEMKDLCEEHNGFQSYIQGREKC